MTGFRSRFGAQAAEHRAFRPVWPTGVLRCLPALIGSCRSTSCRGGYTRSGDPEACWRDLERRARERTGPGPCRLDFAVEIVRATKERGWS